MPNDEEDKIVEALNGIREQYAITMFGDMENKGIVTRIYRNEEDIKDLQDSNEDSRIKEEESVKEERKFRRQVIMVLIGGIFSLVTAIIVT